MLVCKIKGSIIKFEKIIVLRTNNMTLKTKIKSIKIGHDIYAIKLGKFLKVDNQCYQTSKLFRTIFKVYYYLIVPNFFIFAFLLMPHYFDNLALRFMETFILYLVIDYILVLLVPLKKVHCLSPELDIDKFY